MLFPYIPYSYYHYDYYSLLLLVPALLLGLWAQLRVSAAYGKYSRVRSARHMTGQMVARRILDENGLRHIAVERVAGRLSDHYDPRTNVVRLSEGVYDSDSIAAVGVAAHECGHAVQHAEGYAPMKLRSAVIPATNIGTKLAIPLLFFGLILDMYPLVLIGIGAYMLLALFQLLTLPVEYNASARAMQTIAVSFILDDEEARGARRMLNAAALTYVAALVSSVAQVLRLLLVFGGRGRNGRSR